MKKDIEFKTIKVSYKGQIFIPSGIQREIGLKKGDELLLIRKGKRIVLEKPERIAKVMKDEFKDMRILTERSLKRLWLNKEDEIWNQYLKSGK